MREMTRADWPRSSRDLSAAVNSADIVTPWPSSIRGEPTSMVSAPITACTPAPGWAVNSLTGCHCISRRRASATTARAIGCSLPCSAAAANRNNSSTATPGIGSNSPSTNRPSVSVPVLSKANACTLESCSIAPPLLTRTPVPASRASAAMIAAGVAKIRGQGQATTKTESAG